MNNKDKIKPEQANVLEELEKFIGKTIPIVDDIKGNIVGAQIEGEDVVELSLVNCQQNTLPESIKNLRSLKKLSLFHNKFTTLPKSIGNLESLEHLSLIDNKLESLPESIGNLKSLQIIYLGFNQLETLPDSIKNLTSLLELHLSYNNLKTIPNSIGNLTSLIELDLSINNIDTLPESIGKLESLEKLNLRGNPIVILPESMKKLKSLKELRAYKKIFKKNPYFRDIRIKSSDQRISYVVGSVFICVGISFFILMLFLGISSGDMFLLIFTILIGVCIGLLLIIPATYSIFLVRKYESP